MAGLSVTAVPRVVDAIPRALLLTCFALAASNIVWLVLMYTGGYFFIDTLGRPKPADFVNVWAAGRLALEGKAAAAYDWTLHKQVENVALGYDFTGYYGWHYPPPFLFVAAVLALFPYLAAFILWMAITLPIYLGVVRWIVGNPAGWLVALGFPAFVTNLFVGQNGFLTASLIGGTLGLMEKRPVLSGVCLGLLTYKPQFGLLFPLALIAGRRWTVFWTAGGVAAALAAVSWFVFDTETWRAFFEWLPRTSNAILSEGRANLSKQQSFFALIRTIGGSESLAWSVHLTVLAATAVALWVLWRSRAAFELKAAALVVATFLATPYSYLYDSVILAVAAAFLVRLGLNTGFRHYEPGALAAAAILMSSFPFVGAPVALCATLILVAVVTLRAYRGSIDGNADRHAGSVT